MDKTIVISLLIFFLLLYIEWNNINSSIISFMFDHRFIPHHKFSVTSLFFHYNQVFFLKNKKQKNPKTKQNTIKQQTFDLAYFFFCMTAVKEKRQRERKKHGE